MNFFYTTQRTSTQSVNCANFYINSKCSDKISHFLSKWFCLACRLCWDPEFVVQPNLLHNCRSQAPYNCGHLETTWPPSPKNKSCDLCWKKRLGVGVKIFTWSTVVTNGKVSSMESAGLTRIGIPATGFLLSWYQHNYNHLLLFGDLGYRLPETQGKRKKLHHRNFWQQIFLVWYQYFNQWTCEI